MVRPRILATFAALSFAAATFAALGAATAAPGDDTLVSVGSPVTPFSQNKQNEPAVAVDAHAPNVLVAGANDEIDKESCAAGDPTDLPVHPGRRRVRRVLLLRRRRASWTQPTYTGLTRARLPRRRRVHGPHAGPIGTLPGYYEAGLVSDGDPAVAFGPRRGADGRSPGRTARGSTTRT